MSGAYEWTDRVFGIGARSIALIDAAAQSPLAQVSMIPLLTLIAINAPPGHRATWFALMASLMNLALVAGSLQTKYLNLLFPVDRGAYGDLLYLVAAVVRHRTCSAADRNPDARPAPRPQVSRGLTVAAE